MKRQPVGSWSLRAQWLAAPRRYAGLAITAAACCMIGASMAAAQTFQAQQAINTEICEKHLGVNNCETIRTDRISRDFTIAKLNRSLFKDASATASHCTRLTSTQAQCAASVSITTDPVSHRLIWSYTNTFIKSYGGPGYGAGQFLSPRGVAVSRREVEGHAVFVADAANNRIAVLVVNHTQRVMIWLGAIDGLESGKKLRMPKDVAYDHSNTWTLTDDRLFILDTGNDRVLVYQVFVNMHNGTWTKQYLGQFGTTGSGQNQLAAPSSISVFSRGMLMTDVVIADEGNKRLALWWFDTNSPSEFPTNPAAACVSASYSTASFSAVTHDGEMNVFASDRSGHRLLKFQGSNLTELASYGNNSQSWALGNFNSPSDVDVVRSHTQDASGNLVTTGLPFLKTTEAWTATTGMQLHRLGVDASNLSVQIPSPTAKEATFSFLFTGQASSYTARIMTSDITVRTLATGAAVAGWRSLYWDGKNDAGQQMGAGNYAFVLDYTGNYSDDVARSASATFRFRDPPQLLVTSISGPTSIPINVQRTWSGTYSGGWDPYTWNWWRRDAGGEWTVMAGVATNAPNTWNYVGSAPAGAACTTFDLMFDAGSADGQAQSSIISVYVEPGKFGCGPVSPNMASNDVPTEFSLGQLYSAASNPGLSFSQSPLTKLTGPAGSGQGSLNRASTADRLRRSGITSFGFGIPETNPLISKARTNSQGEVSGIATSTGRSDGRVVVRIYDSGGRLVRVAINGPLEPGYYQYDWDGKNDAGRQLAPGAYTVIMTAAGFQRATKLVLVR